MNERETLPAATNTSRRPCRLSALLVASDVHRGSIKRNQRSTKSAVKVFFSRKLPLIDRLAVTRTMRIFGKRPEIKKNKSFFPDYAISAVEKGKTRNERKKRKNVLILFNLSRESSTSLVPQVDVDALSGQRH